MRTSSLFDVHKLIENNTEREMSEVKAMAVTHSVSKVQSTPIKNSPNWQLTENKSALIAFPLNVTAREKIENP